MEKRCSLFDKLNMVIIEFPDKVHDPLSEVINEFTTDKRHVMDRLIPLGLELVYRYNTHIDSNLYLSWMVDQCFEYLSDFGLTSRYINEIVDSIVMIFLDHQDEIVIECDQLFQYCSTENCLPTDFIIELKEGWLFVRL